MVTTLLTFIGAAAALTAVATSSPPTEIGRAHV